MQSHKCGAKNRDGSSCSSWAMANGRCRMHGGSSLIGSASGTYKEGRYSKLLPAQLAAKYEEARKDPDLLVLRDEVALLDTRLSGVLEGINSGESEGIWSQLQGKNKALRSSLSARDNDRTNRIVRELSTLILTGTAEIDAWGEVYTLLEQRRRLVESERKRLVEMQQMITTERAMTLLSVVLDTIQRHVTDRPTLAAISADFRKLTVLDSS